MLWIKPPRKQVLRSQSDFLMNISCLQTHRHLSRRSPPEAPKLEVHCNQNATGKLNLDLVKPSGPLFPLHPWLDTIDPPTGWGGSLLPHSAC